MPICLAGGKVTSEQILREKGVGVPWGVDGGGGGGGGGGKEGEVGRSIKEIDRLQSYPLLSNIHIFGLLALLALILYAWLNVGYGKL